MKTYHKSREEIENTYTVSFCFRQLGTRTPSERQTGTLGEARIAHKLPENKGKVLVYEHTCRYL